LTESEVLVLGKRNSAVSVASLREKRDPDDLTNEQFLEQNQTLLNTELPRSRGMFAETIADAILAKAKPVTDDSDDQ